MAHRSKKKHLKHVHQHEAAGPRPKPPTAKADAMEAGIAKPRTKAAEAKSAARAKAGSAKAAVGSKATSVKHAVKARAQKATHKAESVKDAVKALKDTHRPVEARQWAEQLLAHKAAMPRDLQRRERPWFRKAKALLKRMPQA